MSKRVSLHDRDDAAGITEGAAVKTGSAVEALIAPAVVAGEQSIVHIPCGKIMPHPRNRKILDEDVADLVAEFKAGVPILNALGVTAAADWNAGKPEDLKPIQSDEFIITAGGHRRLRAAELAGLKTVPCIIRSTFAGADGRRAALLENLHRQDLDPFEEAEAFAELTSPPYKLSQRDLAGMCNVNQSHISKRLKLLKLPKTVRAKYDVGKLKIADCLELARLADAVPGMVEHAAKRLVDEHWSDAARVVEQIIKEDEAAKVCAVEVERLTAAGVKVLDRQPTWQVEKNGREPVRLDRIGIKTVSHKKEPCHAAYVKVAGYQTLKAEVIYACTEPKRHIGAKAESTVKAAKNVTSVAAPSMSSDERARRKRAKEIKKEINPARRAVVAQLLQHGGFSADTRREIIVQSVIFRASFHSYTDNEIVIDLLGIRPANERADPDEVFAAYVEKSRDLAATGAALGYFESQLRDPGPWTKWDDNARWYLELLGRHGYVITDQEHEQLGAVRAASGEWTRSNEPDLPEPPKCRVCFVDMDQLAPGVTAVDEDLCSGCSDAKDAGWVVDEQPPLEVPRPYQHVDEQGFIECLECEHGQPTEGCDCAHCFCNPANVDEAAAAEAVPA